MISVPTELGVMEFSLFLTSQAENWLNANEWNENNS